MGMAASQARFLSLTARKSNVEYEGQQINQERTALANESSNLYAQLSKMDVPAPPNTSDYYKTVYSFSTSQLNAEKFNITYTLDDIMNTPEGLKAYLSHDVNIFVNQAASVTGNAYVDPRSNEEGFRLGDRTEFKNSEASTYDSAYNVNGGMLSGLLFNNGQYSQSYAIYLESATDNKSTLDVLNGDNTASQDYVHKFDGLDGDYLAFIMVDGVKHYLTVDQLTKDDKNNYPSIGGLATVKKTEKRISEEFDVVTYEEATNGRKTSITVATGDKDANGNPVQYTFELQCTSVQDEEAYEQAMRDYEFYQAQYEKNVTDLNAKTEAIQQKDKSLELELKQLDTEQNAIATEMDAVTKVVEDNVESTFKTFA